MLNEKPHPQQGRILPAQLSFESKELQDAELHNSSPRTDWSAILGEPLPVFVFRKLREKRTGKEIEDLILQAYYAHAKNETRASFAIEHVVKINVQARTAEYNRFFYVIRSSTRGLKRCSCGGYRQHKLSGEHSLG
jgi:hypothetical protein